MMLDYVLANINSEIKRYSKNYFHLLLFLRPISLPALVQLPCFANKHTSVTKSCKLFYKIFLCTNLNREKIGCVLFNFKSTFLNLKFTT